MTDDEGNRIPVSGEAPELAVDAEGYWTVDGVRVEDASGKEVKASGKDGDAFFRSVTDGETEVVFELTDGQTIVIPKTGAVFGFVQPEDGRSCFVFGFGERRTLSLRVADVTTADFMNVPEGWTASFDLAGRSVTLKAPAASDGVSYAGGIVTLIGIRATGETVFASAEVCASVDFTDAGGTFVVCEGNMTSANGMLVWYDKSGKEYEEVFEQANGGKEIGNVVQDMFMANDRIYLLTQNGGSMNGAGRFVVCDARTMRMEYADPLVIKTPEGKDTWPQHLVVVSPTKAYVQYSESGMEATSGICALTLGDGSVEVGATVEGVLSGRSPPKGPSRPAWSSPAARLFAGCGHSLVIVDPATDAVEKRITYEGRQVKGVVKGADGNIYFALAGTFTGNQNMGADFTSAAKIVGIDHEGREILNEELPGGRAVPRGHLVACRRHVRRLHRSVPLFRGYGLLQRDHRDTLQLRDENGRRALAFGRRDRLRHHGPASDDRKTVGRHVELREFEYLRVRRLGRFAGSGEPFLLFRAEGREPGGHRLRLSLHVGMARQMICAVR